MPLLILILQLLTPVSDSLDEGPEKMISCHYRDVPFPAFCQEINVQEGVRIYYHDAWVNKILVTLDTDNISVIDAVRLALEGTDLKVSSWNGDLVLLPGEELPGRLPAYDTSQPELESNGAVPDASRAESQFITGRRSDVTQTIVIGKKGQTANHSPVRITGRIIEESTGDPVYGATIYIEESKSGTTTGPDGSLAMEVRPGKYTVRFEYLGYEKKKYHIEVLSAGDFLVEMRKAVIQMEEVVVFGDRQMNIRSKDPGLEKISVKLIKQIPMMMGERDIIRVSGMLPGIVTIGEGSAGLNVRGGNSDQNAFYLNKVPVYNTSHLFGFFSSFEADIIKDFSIYKGYIPLEFGGRLSSVFSIGTRQGSREQFGARGGVSPVAANLTVEGPLKKDKSSYLISGRMLYSDWILGRIKDPVIRTSQADFHDFSLSLGQDLGKSQLTFFAYHTLDRIGLSDLNTFHYSNNGACITLGHQFTSSLRADFSLVGAYYAFGTIDEQQPTTAYEHDYSIGHYEAKAEFRHDLEEKHHLEYGSAITLYRLDRGVVSPYGPASIRSVTNLGKELGTEVSAYVSDFYKVRPWLSLSMGLRFSAYTLLGPMDVLTYAPGGPRDPRYVDDTLSFRTAEAIRWYAEPDVRFSATFETDPEGSVKIAFNQMHQNLFMLSNTIALAPNSQWKLADYYIKPSQSWQISAGIFRTIRKFGLDISAELFFKRTSQFAEFTDGADFLENPHVESIVLQGKLKSYGVEFLLKKQGKKLEGWLAYTYSRASVRVDGIQPWEKINGGEEYPANWDIPHVLNTVINYHFNRRITFSTVLTYQAGKPATFPTSIYYVNGVQYVDYSSRNEYRIPHYFRVDASLTLEGNLKKKKPLHSSLVIGVYNLTGRENPYSVYFTTETGKIKSYQYSVIGVPIYTVTWLFKLGNYATE